MKNDMRDRLIKLIRQSHCVDVWDYWNDELKQPNPIETLADHLIKNDVVPVVRCKDCKHCDHFYPRCDKDGTLEEMYSCMMFDYIVQPDCYCSYGEMK